MEFKIKPRVLLLTPEAFNKITGAGITLTNLFRGWPSDAIATIHRDFLPVTEDVCTKYYRLTHKEIHWWGWLRYIQLLVYKSGVPEQDLTPLQQNKFLKRLIKYFKRLIFGDGVPEQVNLTPELEAWIREFSPTVIYTTLGSNAMMTLADSLRVRFHLPVVIHVMDDWVSVIYRGGFLSYWQRKKKDRLFRYMVEVATECFAICNEMAEAYSQRYKKTFRPFQNAIDVDVWLPFKKNPLAISSPVRVAYIGSIFQNAQLTSLCDICKAVQQLKDEGFLITFEIYSPNHLSEQYREQLILGSAISLYDSLPDDITFFSTLQAVDILVLPVNFDRNTVEFIRYSMPTKIPAYLTVGTPILAYGPAEVAQISYARKAGWAITLQERNREQLKVALTTLATDSTIRATLSEAALIAATEKHDAKLVRPDFQSRLAFASGCSFLDMYAK